MTHEEIVTMLERANLPLAYDHFTEGESPDPPFLVFLFPESNNMFADDSVYQMFTGLNVELYTDKKDPVMEEILEKIFSEYDLPWEKSEVWIDSEKMYEVLYQMTILYDGGNNDGEE